MSEGWPVATPNPAGAGPFLHLSHVTPERRFDGLGSCEQPGVFATMLFTSSETFPLNVRLNCWPRSPATRYRPTDASSRSSCRQCGTIRRTHTVSVEITSGVVHATFDDDSGNDYGRRNECTLANGPPDPPLLSPAPNLDCKANCGFRGNAATDSDGKRPPNPIESGHLIRTKAATLLTG
jgi:hypothetical protein